MTPKRACGQRRSVQHMAGPSQWSSNHRRARLLLLGAINAPLWYLLPRTVWWTSGEATVSPSVAAAGFALIASAPALVLIVWAPPGPRTSGVLFAWGLLYAPFVPLIEYGSHRWGHVDACPGCSDWIVGVALALPVAITMVGVIATIVATDRDHGHREAAYVEGLSNRAA